LEWVCRAAAIRGALDGDLRPPLRLFVNAEPSTLAARIPPHHRDVMASAAALDVVVELTERALTDRPADVLGAVPHLRSLGVTIALDDIGADRRSLALMPFLAPEVIKLDLRLVQSRPTAEIAAIVHAVNAQAERTGAVIVAEGIENERQHEVARALGACWAQGWHYGRPDALPGVIPITASVAPSPPLTAPRRADGAPTPFGVVAERQTPRRGPKGLLLAMSHHLEEQAMAHAHGAAVVLATFQEARHFTPATRARYERLASSAAVVGALGVDLSAEPAPGVRGTALSHGERLRGEWNVIVLDPHFAAAFVAHDLGDDGPDFERRFDFCLTYDRDLVIEAARALMARVAPAL